MLRIIYILILFSSSSLLAQINKDFIETLYKPSNVKDIELSPSGKYAGLIHHEDKIDYLDVYDLDTRGGSNIQIAGSERVKFKEINWVDNDTLFVYWNDSVRDKISVFHLNYEGEDISIAKRFTFAGSGAVLHHLPDEENKIIFAERSENVGYKNFYKIDITEEQDVKSLFSKENNLGIEYDNVTDWAFDAANELRFIESNINEEFVYYYKDKQLKQWREIAKKPDSELNYFFALDDQDRLVASVRKDEDRRIIAYFNPLDMQQTSVAYEDPNYDVSGPIFDKENKLLGVSLIKEGVAQQEYFDEKINSIKNIVKEKKAHETVYIISSSLRSDRYLLLSSANGFHFKYYDYTLSNGTLKFTKDPRPWLKTMTFSDTETLRVSKPDGTVVEAYLSLPTNVKSNIPLIVNPHGGPFGIRDYKYDRETEILVSHGYAVLRVNFRGSSGFGTNYINSAKQGLGTIIEEDIFQSLQYVLERYPIDKQRICSVGISYGGYSTAMLLAKHPDTFKCGVSFAGVFDLGLQINEAKRFSLYKDGLDKYFKDYIADLEARPELQKEKSPIYHAEKIKSPLLLLHGTNDPVVDMEQSYRMKHVLDEAGAESELHIFDGFSHGFRNSKETIQYFEKVIPFLENNL